MIIFGGNAWQTKVLTAGIDPLSNKLAKLTNHVSSGLVALEGLKKGINNGASTHTLSIPDAIRDEESMLPLLYLVDRGSCPQVPA